MAGNIKKNTVLNMIKVVSQIIFPLITFPYISRVLHAERMGEVNYANSIYSYIALIASLSITNYAVRECSTVKDDKKELGQVASQLFSINMWSTLIAYTVMIVICCIPRFQNVSTLIVVYCVNLIFTTLGADWINIAVEDFKFITIRTVAFQAISLVLMFLFVHGPEDYLSYVIINVIASSGANILNLAYRRKYCKVSFLLHPDARKHLPPILKFFAAVITQQIYVNSDVIMLGLMKGNRDVGLYSSASKIFEIANLMIASIFTVALSQACKTYAEADFEKYNKVLREAVLFLIEIGVPCVVGMILIPKNIISLVSGAEYTGAALSLMIFGFALFFSFFHGFFGNLLAIPMGDFNIGIIAALVSSIANIVLNIFLIPKFGYNAAAFTTMLAELVSAIILGRKINKNVKIKNVSKAIFHTCIGCAAFSAFLIFMKKTEMQSVVQTLIMVLGSIVIYGIVMLITKDEFAISNIRMIKMRK